MYNLGFMKYTRLFFLTLIVSGLAFVSCKNNTADLVPVAFQGKWGYINSKGEYEISPRYKDAGFFYNDLAMVKSFDGNVGYINKNAEYVIASRYKYGTIFNEGYAIVVERGENPSCVDTKGNIVFTMKNVLKLYNFREGLAAFQDTSKKYGFVDTKGTIVIEPKYENVYFGFSEGLAPVLFEGKWGYIDKTGKMVISAQFASAGLFSDGLAAASTEGVLYGYIGTNGLYKVHPQFDGANMFVENRAVVKLAGKYATVKPNGKIDVNPLFDEIKHYSNGFALMRLGDMYGYLNSKGEMSINAQFAWGSDFYGGFAAVKTFDQYGEYRYGIVDEDGRFESFPNFDNIKQSYVNCNEADNYVKSDYYDASEFVTKFMKKASDNSFDGFNGKSTIQTIADSKLYGDFANATDTMTVMAMNYQKFTKDIVCNATEFDFANKIFTIDSVDERTPIYKLDEPMIMFAYQFQLKNGAWDKGCAVSKALSNAMSAKLNVAKVSKDGYYYVLQEDGKCSFVVLYSDTTMSMAISYKQDKMQALLDYIESAHPTYVKSFFNGVYDQTPSTGDVQMLLSWNNINDLDLYCVDPKKETICYKHKTSKSGGILEIDRNAVYVTNTPIENIFWPTEQAPKGHYAVYVNMYRARTVDPTTPYTVMVKHGDDVDTFSGIATTVDKPVKVFEFDIK